MGGAHKKREQEAQQEAAATQQQQATNEKLASYQRAFGACMEGRGYVLK
jgi:hypothetical protein